MSHFIIYLIFAFFPITDTPTFEDPRAGDNGREDTEIIIKDDMGG